MTILAVPGVSYARANWGRWIADCSRPHCRNALAVHPGDPVLLCGDCGTRSEITWPADVPLIEELLRARPDPTTRNWEPGEPVNHLLVENLAYGITHATAPELGAAASRLVLDATGDDKPTLRLLDQPLVIDAHPTHAIGA